MANTDGEGHNHVDIEGIEINAQDITIIESMDLQDAQRNVDKNVQHYLPIEVMPVEEYSLRKRRKVDWLYKAVSSAYRRHDFSGEDELCLAISDEHRLKSARPCTFCEAKRFEHEPPTFCCRNGDIKLDLPSPPHQLKELFTAETEDAEHFRKNIHAYNSIFSFTSFGVTIDHKFASSRKGVYTFRAQGQVYHKLPSLLPEDNIPRYFQLYFFDTEHEISNRATKVNSAVLSENVLVKIKAILDENPYSKFFRQLKDLPTLANVELHIAATANVDQRVYNKPSVDQVAAIWIDGNDPSIPFDRDIVVHEHSGTSYRVKHYYGCYDPLQHPLLFPMGESGWHQGIKKNKAITERRRQRHTSTESLNIHNCNTANELICAEYQEIFRENNNDVSCRAYYCYKLQIREASESILQYSGRLFQQFVVDMYTKVETTRLEYHRKLQIDYRKEILQGILDSISVGETRGDKVGSRVILPAAFVGGPRDMRRRFMDSMELVQRFGKPDLFITMTCNPDWPEIKDALYKGQNAQDRPDIVARVFRAKLQDLKDQIFKKNIFGCVIAHVHVIEFQKRGLPHVHMLLIMKESDKVRTPDQYDQFVTAELPDKFHYPELYKLVVKHMMHGPCGIHNPTKFCMVNGKCKFKYPRQFCSKSLQGKDGYPVYRRRDNYSSAQVRGMKLNNQWVAPYNPYLLMRYNCHINVKVCAGVRAVKYLYKYIYKGHDKCTISLQPNGDSDTLDEIQNFQDARWVSLPEALWRMYEFPLSEMQPPVINLQLHLPNKQTISYWHKENLENVIGWAGATQTMLLGYFKKCATDSNARSYLYKEFPEHYVWNRDGKFWRERKNRAVIGRIAIANPREGERYYLRLLLNHVRGPTSFEDLLTVNGHICKTFKESARERGLLESDDSISECLREASVFQMPRTLRGLFATLLVHCNPADIRTLWDTYYEDLSDDFRRISSSSNSTVVQWTLQGINSYLESMGRNVADYDLPKLVTESQVLSRSECKEITEERLLQVSEEDLQSKSALNDEQQNSYRTIFERIEDNKGGIFFIDGPGGTGKTFLYKALLANVRSLGKIALATATSGVAASIMPGGRTAHSRFDIPLNADETSITKMTKQSGAAKLIRESSLVIWDEAPMARRQMIETVDRSFRDIMENDEPFGGKVVVFGGDFRQVLPVVQKASRFETINSCLVKSYLWPLMEKIKLKRNMRARKDSAFCDFLLRVGNGTEPIVGDSLVKLPDDIVVTSDSDNSGIQTLIDHIFPSLHQNAASHTFVTERAILASRNEYADELNNKLISVFPDSEVVYTSFDSASDDVNNFYQEEYLNSLTPNGLPPHRLVLKVNAPIMLLRNLDAAKGLCNGTRMICKGFDRNVIHAQIVTGHCSGQHVFIPRILLSPPENEGHPLKFQRKQFPVRLCFAMTINKSQGQTIPHVGLYLPHHVFSHGQLYVALSRGISMATTKVLVLTEQPKRRKGTYAKNIVYKEVLGSSHTDA